MSDGGAGAIVGAVSLLAQSRQGRIVLVVVGGYLGLVYLVNKVSTGVLVAILAVVVVLAAVVGHFVLLRRKRKERASMMQMLSLLGLLALAVAGAVFVLLRRKRAAEVAAVPSASEVDRWAASQTGQRA